LLWLSAGTSRISSGSEIVWLKQASKIPHLMATVSVMVDLLDLIAKYRNIATGSW